MTVDELKKFYNVRHDKQLCPKLNVSASTICKWRKYGIKFIRQQAIQLETNGKLKARLEDENLKEVV